MNNEKIAQALEMLADLLEFTGANAFRLRAYRSGARAIEELPNSIAALIDSKTDLTSIAGIGKGVAEKCLELVNTGSLQQLEEVLQRVPASVLDLIKIPKLGPKKAAVLFNELGIENLEQLRLACESQQVRKLAGFGEKTEAAILAGIPLVMASEQSVLWSTADLIGARLREYLLGCNLIQQFEFAGSYRRGKDTVSEIEVLITSNDPAAMLEYFQNYSEITAVTMRDDTKMSVRLAKGFPVELRVVPAATWGSAWQYYTGSQQHNAELRDRAEQLGLRIDERGVFRIADYQANWIAGHHEAEVYQALGLPWIPPELREGRHEFSWAEQDELTKLIELTDIQGDLHMHTTSTDGNATIEEMAAAARANGLKYIAITDHSKRVAMANGLTSERVLAQWKQIDEINRRALDDFRILKGIECDILENGEMDLPADVLSQGEWIIASLHYGQHQPRQQITDRILAAIANPFVSMIAHPTGRLLNKRKPYDVDLEAVFQAAIEHRKLLELNASPYRLDLNEIHLNAAKSVGIPIVINTDAHRIAGLADMRFGIQQARRGGLVATDVANTRPWSSLKNLIGGR